MGSTTPSFDVFNRADDVPQPWNFYINEDVKDQISPSHDVYVLGRELIRIPVHSLPCPVASESDDWFTSGTISEYDLMETWGAYLDAMSKYGDVLHSEFTEIDNGATATTLPRQKSAIQIVLELPERYEDDVYFLATIWGTGKVEVRVGDSRGIKRFLPESFKAS